MNNSVYKFSLDVHEATSQVVVELKQTDTAREFQISLTENGRPYVITEGCYAVFTAEKSDGTKLYHECIIDGNVIHYTTQPQTTSAVGEAFCEIQLYGANEALLISPSFIMLVHEKIFKDGDIPDSNNDFSALVNIYERTNALYDDVRQKLESGELRGADGKDGADGKSAYEIARENGFQGTELEWLESLKGTGGLAEIPDNSISTAKIQQNAVTTEKLADNAVTSNKIADNSIVAGKIANNTISSNKILTGSITTPKIINGAVTPEKLDRVYATPDDVKAAVEGVTIPDFSLQEASVGNEHLKPSAVTGEKIKMRAVNKEHISEKAVGTFELDDFAVTNEKINNKTITKSKLAFEAATEDFVRNSIRNISGGKPLIGDVVSILDDFEGYEIHQVVKTTDLIPKNWSNVKIWSADDGITDTEANPFEFDFSQISETNYVKTKALPSQVDFSSIEGKKIMSSMIFLDEEERKFLCVQLMQPTGSDATLQFIFYNGGNEESCYWFYTAGNGWTKGDGVSLTENDLMIPEGTYPSLKILDFASLHKDNPEVAPEGVETSPEILIDLFLKDWMQFYYPMGYYLTDKSADTIPKSWAEVQRVVKSGQASRIFNIGDQLICTKNGVAHVWDIIGIDYDTPENYNHSITLQLHTGLEYRAFDDDSNNYSDSSMRAHLNGDYLTGFDEDFLAVIGGIRKPELKYKSDGESYPECDLFFLLSAEEVSTNAYEYYSQAETNPETRIKAVSSGANHWWLRSNTTASGNIGIADKIGTDGEIGAGNITRTSYYLVPACVIY